jgi:hypothetical protein
MKTRPVFSTQPSEQSRRFPQLPLVLADNIDAARDFYVVTPGVLESGRPRDEITSPSAPSRYVQLRRHFHRCSPTLVQPSSDDVVGVLSVELRSQYLNVVRLDKSRKNPTFEGVSARVLLGTLLLKRSLNPGADCEYPARHQTSD